MKDYSKIFKLIMLGLIVVSVAILAAGWIAGFEAGGAWPVDLMFIWTYVMVVLAIIGIIFIDGAISARNDRGFLKKTAITVVGIVAFVVVVYLLSPGKPAVGMLEQPSQGTLRLTDTILNLTYILAVGAILAIIGGEVYRSVREKKQKKANQK